MNPLIIDSRETNSGIPRLLVATGVLTDQQELAEGDYRIGNILVERKTGIDLAASIFDNRLFSQAEAISIAAERPMLLIEGDIHGIRSQIQEDALLGAISAIAVFWQVGVLWSPDTSSTAKLLATMWRHVNLGLGYEVPLRAKKPAVKPDGAAAQYLVEGLPGVGPDTARKLITHFKTPRGVFGASAEQLRACKEIGPRTAESISTALDLAPTTYRLTKGPPG